MTSIGDISPAMMHSLHEGYMSVEGLGRRINLKCHAPKSVNLVTCKCRLSLSAFCVAGRSVDSLSDWSREMAYMQIRSGFHECAHTESRGVEIGSNLPFTALSESLHNFLDPSS